MRQLLVPLFLAAAASLVQAQAVAPESAASPASEPSRQAARREVSGSVLGSCARRAPAYPAAALRLEQQGTTWVGFTVDAAGRIDGPRLYRSSQSAVLDQAALQHLQACITAFEAAQQVAQQPALPEGRFILPIEWRLE